MLTLDPPADGPENMGRDRELLRAAESGHAGARMYTWDSIWVTLGRGQDPLEALVAPQQTPWIVRPTGGGAVLHGHDITVSLAAPMRRSVRGSYRIVARPVVEALASLGLAVGLGEDRPNPQSGAPAGSGEFDCFATCSANDIVELATGRKLCGCALRRTANAVLLQASIPIHPPTCDPASVIKGAVAVIPLTLSPPKFEMALRSALAHWDFGLI